ncbi:MAG: universal stress protein [Halobacteriota archaeon]|uniref:universal stress protein n=1 Tax=Halodesulfurarchaeum sp. HSR-GB TaxID=3074077 RepID=UPI002865CD48|nr:universal stress protein [Halodesulfurarchaeum sp. HSR-GB]MDR5656112.1 universal stress protein [Halodesulfurarchaeum sp. HSR-GB]
MTTDRVLVPIDGSDVSYRALSYAVDLAAAFDATLDVVHITTDRTPAAEAVLDRARRILDATDVEASLSLSTDLDLDFRPADRLGEDVLDLVAERGADHVVMGHAEPPGPVERALLGSAAETVLRSERVRLTVVP